MPPKELNRHQLSSKLSYSQNTPAFLQKLKNRIAGVPDEEVEYDEEWEDDGSGRPPIPRRPAIPHRPDDDPGSADESDGDEKPQVVVLREGKHLTAHEAENVRRKEKGLPPLEDPAAGSKTDAAPDASASKDAATTTNVESTGLSFSSSKGKSKLSNKKRKAVGDIEDLINASKAAKASKTADAPAKKKAKKEKKALLSFGDDA